MRSRSCPPSREDDRSVLTMTRTRVRLTFPPNLIQEPILYRLVKDFDIVINIRRADVKEDYGWVALEMEAGEDTLARGGRGAKEKGVQVAPIEGDVVA